MEKTIFTRKVIALIKKIPKARVATYGQIARLAGNPQGSRGVAWILHSSSTKYGLPWHRVVNSQGKISFPEGSKLYFEQRELLLREGIIFKPSGKIDLGLNQWKKKS